MEEARQRVLERAGRILEPILDIGTGPGRMAYILAKAGFRLTTLDISKEAQEVAKIYAKRYKVLSKIKFIPMDAQKLRFNNGSFSTTISANLLHDVKNPHRVMQEMIRVTKPHGKVIVSDLNRKGKDLVNKVYRINKEIHRGKPINLKKIVEENFRQSRINFKEYDDGYITIYIGKKI